MSKPKKKKGEDNPDMKTVRDTHDGFLALKAAVEQKGLMPFVTKGSPIPSSKPSRTDILQLLRSAYNLTLELLDDQHEQVSNAPSTINGECTVTCRNSDCSAVLEDDKTCLLINEYEGLAWFCPNCRDDELNCTIKSVSNEPSVLTQKVLEDRLDNFENAIESKVSSFLEEMSKSFNQSYATALGSKAIVRDKLSVDECDDSPRVKRVVQEEVVTGRNSSSKNYSNGTNRSNLCDAKRTVIVRGVTDYEKFIKKGFLTSKEFHKYYPNIVISQIKPTRRGYLLLEMTSSEDAETVVREWKSNFFASDDNSTHASIMSEGGRTYKCVADNVDPSVLEADISESLEDNLGVKPTQVRRMLSRSRTPPVSRFFFHAWNFHFRGSFCCRNYTVCCSHGYGFSKFSTVLNMISLGK